MKIKFSDIEPILNIYNEKIQNLTGSDFSVMSAFRLSKIIKELIEFKQFYADRHNAIITKYGERTSDDKDFVYLDEQRTSVKIREEAVEQVTKEISELQNLELEIQSQLLDISDLEDLKDNLTMQDIVVLSSIIE